ncbi:hypothetical protein C8A05DRAFT_13094 [Staphylotrichum tortipilum]|uniref:Uncharacterized protein n=1 Tax=Staphylotrichum tortipilum TaxID=2831512 RepID=A0AAN6MSS4_9PEZI|nr:hypothetical protein C8A05DRAFT_13094 [Staphylotrichum longicolle]
MADHDPTPPPPPNNSHPRRTAASARHSASASDHSFFTPPATSAMTPAASGLGLSVSGRTPSPSDTRAHEKSLPAAVHRAHKHRSSGGFLLADSLLNRHGTARHRDAHVYPPPDKRQRRSTDHHRSSGGTTHSQDGLTATPSGSDASQPGGLPDESSGSTAVTNRDSLAGETAVGSSPRTSIAQLDLESAQIVNMALNLSESRRLASRRNVSQPTPPKLAPLPDNAAGGSLRYHLQQQRKASRTVSPRPDRSPRVGGGRVFTPLQPAFDPGAGYRYHFSQSTLARAQKAKEYLELMAQYRRVLELVAPLEPPRAAAGWTPTPPATPNDSVPVSRVPTNEMETKIGRPYNPLQYIRNRKVRARERKAIDGEAQGFDDALRVSEWIDDIAKWVATGQGRQLGNPTLPPFAPAQAAEMQASPPSTNGRKMVTAKPKRPRVDWAIEPADMLADIYWLELDDNKRLVEDRQWRRVFPQFQDMSRPLSRDEAPQLATPGSAKHAAEGHTPGEKTPDPPSSHQEHEHLLSTARDRAQLKFRALKGSHHRTASSLTNRDLLRIRRGSLSESSDTDTDRRRRAKGAANSTVRTVLEKQMEEMIAREQREAESHPLYDHETNQFTPLPATPERDPAKVSKNARGRQADPRAELSDADTKEIGLSLLPRPRPPSPRVSGRASLEVPSGRRLSVGNESSQPTSPEMRPAREVGRIPAIGLDLSPSSSRASSPHRNPLNKVKSIFRERSRERHTEARVPGEDGPASLCPPPPESWSGTPETTGSAVPSPQRRPSRSPVGDRPPLGHRSHKSLSSARLRGEDGAISFRSLLRGPRIDSVLRSGVSKVGDMLWRKDGADDSSTSSSDAETEVRGRPRGLRHGRSLSVQDAKSLLEAPQLMTDYRADLLQHPPSRPLSRRSSRFELLKPPRIDVQNASPSASPPPVLVRPSDPVGSDAESQAGGGRDDVRAAAARLDAALTRPHHHHPDHAPWSIADHRRTTTGSTTAISKRDIARLRALLLSSGIHASELTRRASARHIIPTPAPLTFPPDTTTTNPWRDLARLAPDPIAQHCLLTTPLSQTELYPVAARALAASVQASTVRLSILSGRFNSDAVPELTQRVEGLREKVGGELAERAGQAVDAADEVTRDLAVAQRLKVKRVVDGMEKMLRRRRRRFRWVRRAGWLVVEWLLVGCMWYVWFVVMIARVVLGVGKGVVRGVRWLLWL